MDFYVDVDGAQILDVTFGNLSVAESFFSDDVLDLGAYSGLIDLTLGYSLVADGGGGFGFDYAFGGAVPEPSTWAMMLIGFAGLGFAGYRRSRGASPVRVTALVCPARLRSSSRSNAAGGTAGLKASSTASTRADPGRD